MLIEYEGGSRECGNHADITAVLELRNKNGVNEFWVYLSDEMNPCLAILAKDNAATVNYFFEDGNPGFRAVNGASAVNEDGYDIHVGGNAYHLPSDGLLPFDAVIAAVLQAFDTRGRPDNLLWEALWVEA